MTADSYSPAMKVHEPPETHEAPLVILGVAALTVAAVAVSYGSATIFSINSLLAGPTTETTAPDQLLVATLFQLALLGLGLLLGAGAMALAGHGRLREWLAGRPGTTPGSWSLTSGVALAALMAGYGLMLATRVPAPPNPDASDSPVVAITRGIILGGLGEELLVVALPIVTARALAPRVMTRPDAQILLIAVVTAMRMSYHLHYGPWALALLPWALLTAVVYLRLGQVWPLILAHAAYNVTLAMIDLDLLSQAAALTLIVGSALALIAFGAARARTKAATSLS